MTTQKWKYSGALWFSVSVHMFDKSYKPKRVVSTFECFLEGCMCDHMGSWHNRFISMQLLFWKSKWDMRGWGQAKPFLSFLGAGIERRTTRPLWMHHPVGIASMSLQWKMRHGQSPCGRAKPTSAFGHSTLFTNAMVLGRFLCCPEKVAQRSTTGWNLLIFGP